MGSLYFSQELEAPTALMYFLKYKIGPLYWSKGIISNGNRTEWSPIRSVIIQVINKIGRPRSRSPICLITSMITDRIGRHEVLLPVNHNFNKICDIIGYFFKSKHKKFEICFASSKRVRDGAYCPIT